MAKLWSAGCLGWASVRSDTETQIFTHTHSDPLHASSHHTHSDPLHASSHNGKIRGVPAAAARQVFRRRALEIKAQFVAMDLDASGLVDETEIQDSGGDTHGRHGRKQKSTEEMDTALEYFAAKDLEVWLHLRVVLCIHIRVHTSTFTNTYVCIYTSSLQQIMRRSRYIYVCL